jgi:sRNA-binding protein
MPSLSGYALCAPLGRLAVDALQQADATAALLCGVRVQLTIAGIAPRSNKGWRDPMVMQDHHQVIGLLADAYPKTFFVNPRRRMPLKSNIEQDIRADLINNKESELRFFNIEDAVDWYRSNIGYHIACSTAGNERVDLSGKAVAKVTEAEARVEQQNVTEIQRQITARRNSDGRYSFSPTPERAPPAPPPLKILTPNTNLSDAEMFAKIEKQLKSVAAIVVGEFVVDESLRADLARPVLRLIMDELKTIDARLG